MGERPRPLGPGRRCDRCHRPRLHGGRRCLRGDQGRRRAAVRADPSPGAARALCGVPRTTRRRIRRLPGRSRGRARSRAPVAGSHPDHLHGRTGTARLRQGRRQPDHGGRRRGHGAGRADHCGGQGAVAPQRAGRARGREVHVVRRERGRPRLRRQGRARPRPCSPTWPGTCAKAPGRTSATSSTARCARRRWPQAAWPASREPCSSSGPTCVEVDEPIEVLDRPPRRSSWSRPPATSRAFTAATVVSWWRRVRSHAS